MKAVIASLIGNGRVSRPIIGISFLDASQAKALGIDKGVLVLSAPADGSSPFPVRSLLAAQALALPAFLPRLQLALELIAKVCAQYAGSFTEALQYALHLSRSC